MTAFSVDLRRHIAAPRERVYRALLDPALLVRWMYPPDGCVGGDASVEERVGGRHRIEYLSSDGRRHLFDSTIVELVPDERLVLDFAFAGPEDATSEPDTLLTITLADEPGGGTSLRLVHERVTAREPFSPESVTHGWGGVLDHLQALWADDPEETS